jgi:DNA polymerase III alpha subunit
MDAYNILNTKSIGSICLLAKNNEGYLNLLKLVSFA